MELKKCPICGEEYSPSYKSCPFCEENEDAPAKGHTPKRRITTERKALSARGGLIAVLALVLALFGWYLCSATDGEALPEEPAVETAAPPAPEDFAEPVTPEEPPEPPAPTVDATALAIKTNVGGALPTEAKTGCFDCTLRASDHIRLIVTGTDAPVSEWKSENPKVVSVDSEGWLTYVGTGTTHVVATVGDATVTCIVRAR